VKPPEGWQQHLRGVQEGETLHRAAAFGHISAVAAARPAEPACPGASWWTTTPTGQRGTSMGLAEVSPLLPHCLRRVGGRGSGANLHFTRSPQSSAFQLLLES